ncbi:hypothetical protein NPIL_482481 [Nephila pilipes]|uniref:Uncharacterized protein n=1 Tax=Nephila pilipes TaxID=299642 RepID=A0A8X6URE4_NEPPI|nr:hypothetical protein NPIL_482481 [Nephila pilipes]
MPILINSQFGGVSIPISCLFISDQKGFLVSSCSFSSDGYYLRKITSPNQGKVCGRGVEYDVDDALDVYSAENVLEVESFGYIWVVVRDSGS